MSILASIVSLAVMATSTSQDMMVPSSAMEVKPLMKGAKAPDVKLTSSDGKMTSSLKSILNGKPTVVIFFRGVWCPYCNKHLMELGQIEGDLMKMGYQMVAISPDKPDKTMMTGEKLKTHYRLFSDSKADAIKAFGVGFRVDDATFIKYRDEYKLNLEEWSGMNHHVLPVPSVFIIDKKGMIQFSQHNADYKVRMNGAEVLAAAKRSMM